MYKDRSGYTYKSTDHIVGFPGDVLHHGENVLGLHAARNSERSLKTSDPLVE
ncbi:hypothetical protein J6590_021311 [Homalodisca vitripennis]|nr:hypothetical protein J6590_021311 [Homalodisca vitripennis]